MTTEERKFDPAKLDRYVPDTSLPLTAIVDIDDTLNYTYGEFSPALVSTYEPNPNVIRVVQALYRQGYTLVFLTARPESCRSATFKWLIQNVAPFAELIMRPDGNYDSDWKLKYNLFNEQVRYKYNVDIVIDNGNKPSHMWYALGLTCLAPIGADSDQVVG